MIVCCTLVLSACEKSGAASPDEPVSEKGVVKGRVMNSKGDGLPNTKVVIEHTVYYGTYVYATTNAAGYYKTTVPAGSWKASVRIEQEFEGKKYNFDLCPDIADPFAGSDGAVRNFTWKLKGARPEGNGFFGSNVVVYTQPGSSVNIDDVELSLQPVGPLADGLPGTTITATTIDVGGGEDGIADVPVGKYKITARDTGNGTALQIRLRNQGAYAPSLTALFASGYTGITTYQIVVEVN